MKGQAPQSYLKVLVSLLFFFFFPAYPPPPPPLVSLLEAHHLLAAFPCLFSFTFSEVTALFIVVTIFWAHLSHRVYHPPSPQSSHTQQCLGKPSLSHTFNLNTDRFQLRHQPRTTGRRAPFSYSCSQSTRN